MEGLSLNPQYSEKKEDYGNLLCFCLCSYNYFLLNYYFPAIFCHNSALKSQNISGRLDYFYIRNNILILLIIILVYSGLDGVKYESGF